jgi:serine/threonine-protein kinase
MPACGDVIARKYRITSVIGEGGMGTVFAAHHELLDVPVAVKVLSSSLVRTPGVVDRFSREARAVARLKSEHVARVMDVGTLDGGQPYIVMELLEGEDLRERLTRVGPLPVQQAVDTIMQVLEAMAHAHGAGIVHRDLKPENLFVTTASDGTEVVKVLDFGVAKLSQAAHSPDSSQLRALTVEYTTLGSPHYMAPEQVRDSSQIDHRADLWALGAILYELITGREAFPGESVGEIFGSVMRETPTPIEVLRPDAPWELDAAVACCLTRDPNGRFANVAEMAYALAPLASDAWCGYPERIQQTLTRTRSQRLSDPMLGTPDSGPVSVRRMHARYSSVPSAPPLPLTVSLRAAPLDDDRISKPGPLSEDPRAPSVHGAAHSRRWALLVAAALVAMVAFIALTRPRTRGARDASAAAAVPIGLVVPAPQPLATASLAAAAPNSTSLPPSSSSATTPAPAPEEHTPAAAGHRSKRRALPPPASTPRRGTSSAPTLPSVLSSPE